MIRSEIVEFVRCALVDVTGQPITSLEEEKCLVEDFGLESIDVVDFIFELEKRCQIELDINMLVQHSVNLEQRRFNDFMVKDIIDFVFKVSSK